MRLYLALLALALGGGQVAPVWAQNVQPQEGQAATAGQQATYEGHVGTAEQQTACRGDVLKLCPNMQDDFAMADCLQDHEAKLTPACRQALESYR
jgi:hypothetical protein